MSCARWARGSRRQPATTPPAGTKRPWKRAASRELAGSRSCGRLCGVIQQLGVLSRYAADIFEELGKEAARVTERVEADAARVTALVDELTAAEGVAPDVTERALQHCCLFARLLTRRRLAEVVLERNDAGLPEFFTPRNRPAELQEALELCHPLPALHTLDEFATKACPAPVVRHFSNPQFFFEAWAAAEKAKLAALEAEASARKAARRARRKALKVRAHRRSQRSGTRSGSHTHTHNASLRAEARGGPQQQAGERAREPGGAREGLARQHQRGGPDGRGEATLVGEAACQHGGRWVGEDGVARASLAPGVGLAEEGRGAATAAVRVGRAGRRGQGGRGCRRGNIQRRGRARRGGRVRRRGAH